MNETDENGTTDTGIDISENATEFIEIQNNHSTNSNFTINEGDIFQYFGIVSGSLLFILIVSIFVFLILVKLDCKKRKLSKTKRGDEKRRRITNSMIPSKKFNKSSDILEKDNQILVYNVSNNQVVKYIEEKYVIPVRIENFEKYTETAFKTGAISATFTIIKNIENKPCTYGRHPKLKLKNRYANLFPCDDSRVILEKIPNDPYSDYINANFITGYGGIEKSYIAAQGPNPHTVIDFWRMIWQEKVEVICMVVNLMSNRKQKCEQYWPTDIGNKVLYGAISVEFINEKIYLNYTYRLFKITCGSQKTRAINHLHFTAWPDHDVPSDARILINFLKKLHSLVPIPRTGLEPPILIHSSGGIGRTGTLIVLDMSICRIFSEKLINLYADVVSVRRERLNMISNVRQYLFIHLALVEYLNSKETCINCDENFSRSIENAKKQSAYCYKRILDAEWRRKVFDFWEFSRNQTPTNKRLSNIEGAPTMDGYNNCTTFININSIVKNQSYITTRLPTPSTAVNFWKLLVEQNINIVLFLQFTSLDSPSYNKFVLENQFYVNTNRLKIIKQKNSEKISDCYSEEEVLIIDSWNHNVLLEKIVQIVRFKNWPEYSLPAANQLVKLWKVVEGMHKNEEVCSIAVVCRDGVTASGLWLSLSFLLKNMADFKECDVPYAASTIRKFNKDFMSNQEHLKYLFEIALECSSTNS